MPRKIKRGYFKIKAVGIIGFDELNKRFTLTGKLWEKGEGPPGQKFDRKPVESGDTTIFIDFLDRALLRSLIGKAVVYSEEATQIGEYVMNSVKIETAP